MGSPGHATVSHILACGVIVPVAGVVVASDAARASYGCGAR